MAEKRLIRVFALAISFTLPLIPSAVSQERRGWDYDIGGNVSVSGTDNVDLDATDRESDVVTTTQFTLGASQNTRTSNFRVSGNVAWDAYAKRSSLNGVRYDALASVSSDFFDQRLDFDLIANTSEQSISNSGAESAIDRSIDRNRTQAFNFSAQPTLRSSIGSWAQLQASYTLSGAYFFPTDTSDDVSPASDALIHQGSFTIDSGDFFSRLTLRGLASFEETDREGGAPSSDRRDVQGIIEYLFLPRLTLTSTFGYEQIVEPNFNEDLENPFATAGFRWSPGPRTLIEFSGGYRYDGPNFEGRISYSFNELINFDAQYTEAIETQQRLVLGNLSNITFDPLGAPVDAITGNPIEPGDLPFDLQDSAFRQNAVDFGLSGIFGRNSYRLGGRYETRDTNGSVVDQISMNISLSRDLTALSSLAVTGSFQETSSPLGTNDSTWNARAQYTHRLSNTASIELNYIYIKQDTDRDISFYENALQIRAVKSF